MRKKYIVLIFFVVSIVAITVISGCGEKGSAEKAGENIDQAVESAKETMEEAGEKVTGQGPAEEMGEKIDETIDSAKEAAQEN